LYDILSGHELFLKKLTATASIVVGIKIDTAKAESRSVAMMSPNSEVMIIS